MQTGLMTVGRILLAALFIVSGVRKILGWAGVLAFMQSKGFPTTELVQGWSVVEAVLVATVALEIVGGVLIAINLLAMPAAVLLAAFCLAAGFVFHNFWTIADGAQYANQLNHFMKNVALAGGLLVVAGASAPERD